MSHILRNCHKFIVPIIYLPFHLMIEEMRTRTRITFDLTDRLGFMEFELEVNQLNDPFEGSACLKKKKKKNTITNPKP